MTLWLEELSFSSTLQSEEVQILFHANSVGAQQGLPIMLLINLKTSALRGNQVSRTLIILTRNIPSFAIIKCAQNCVQTESSFLFLAHGLLIPTVLEHSIIVLQRHPFHFQTTYKKIRYDSTRMLAKGVHQHASSQVSIWKLL